MSEDSRQKPIEVRVRREPDAAAIGSALRALREQEDVGLTDMADRMGMAHQNLSRLEHGGRTPTLASLAHFAQTLGYELALVFRPKRRKGS